MAASSQEQATLPLVNAGRRRKEIQDSVFSFFYPCNSVLIRGKIILRFSCHFEKILIPPLVDHAFHNSDQFKGRGHKKDRTMKTAVLPDHPAAGHAVVAHADLKEDHFPFQPVPGLFLQL